MDLDLLSGLLLTLVVVLIAGYLVKEMLGDSIARLVAEYSAKPSAGLNDHLIGAAGEVVDPGEGGGEMRVRIGIERWRARLGGSPDRPLPAGTPIEVVAIDGTVLEVAEAGDGGGGGDGAGL